MGEGLCYLEENYNAARRGINIKRFFIVTENEPQLYTDYLNTIFSLQKMSGVEPSLVYYENIPDNCKSEFVVFGNDYIDEVIFDMRSKRVVDNYICWNHGKVNLFNEKINIIKSHVDYTWKSTTAIANNFNEVRQYASNILKNIDSLLRKEAITAQQVAQADADTHRFHQ